MRLRLPIVVAVVALVVVMVSPQAAAGGGNWLEFSKHVVVGERITAFNRFFDRADVADPPYYAYLLEGPIHTYPPPLRLHENAPVLGRVEFKWAGPNTGWTGRFSGNPRLHIRATVPDVPPGDYVVSICNQPCTDLLKSVDPTYATIYGTLLEARLTSRMDQLRSQVYDARSDGRRARRQIASSMRKDLGETTERLDADMASLQKELAAMEAGLNADSFPWAEITLAGLVALALGATGGLLIGRRQRLPLDWDRLLQEAREAESTRAL